MLSLNPIDPSKVSRMFWSVTGSGKAGDHVLVVVDRDGTETRVPHLRDEGRNAYALHDEILAGNPSVAVALIEESA